MSFFFFFFFLNLIFIACLSFIIIIFFFLVPCTHNEIFLIDDFFNPGNVCYETQHNRKLFQKTVKKLKIIII